jgi:hypothetical protein
MVSPQMNPETSWTFAVLPRSGKTALAVRTTAVIPGTPTEGPIWLDALRSWKGHLGKSSGLHLVEETRERGP